MVEKDTPGLSFGANEKKMGWNTQPTASGHHRGRGGAGLDAHRRRGRGLQDRHGRARWRTAQYRRCSVGGAQAALEKSLAYVGERKAFGKTIDSFQSVQFRLADMATELEVARTFLWRAAAALDRGDPDAKRLSAMAKRFVTDAGFNIANEALQLFGGYGYLADYGIEKIVRDLRVHQILEGTNEIMRVIIARDLIGGRG